MLEPACTPAGDLVCDGRAESAAEARLAAAVQGGAGELLGLLATDLLDEPLPPAWGWLRDWARRYFTRLCQTRDAAAVPPPAADECAAHAAAAPPFPGEEYVSGERLAAWWQALAARVGTAAAGHPDGLGGWLRDHNPAWHMVGRVTFHLAENKADSRRPFAFLATYAESLAASGRPRHLPLARALKDQVGQGDRAALDNLLAPVRAAAAQSPLVRGWLETRRLFQPLALAPAEAHAFLCQVEVLQSAGIVVKVPDWWRGGRPQRPVVSVTIDAPKETTLNARALLSFRIRATLGGEPLDAAELARLCSAETGLVSLRGQWVEVDGERLREALEHWQLAEQAHAGGIDFASAMRMLAGFRLPGARDGEDGSPAESPEWREVLAGRGFARLLDEMREPAPVDPPAALRASLRPYQASGCGWLDTLARLGLGACLADDMGLGKTVQVIACLLRRRERGGGRPALVVVPASLVGNWRAELARFAPSLRVAFAHPSVLARDELAVLAADPARALAGHDAMLTTYQLLARTPGWLEHEWGPLVLDEAQAIKNPGARVTRTVKQLHGEWRLALTGTPVENRPGDLWSLFDFLNPGLLGNATAFARAVKQCAERPDGFAPLRRLVRPYILRRLKTDRSIIADLPEKTEIKAWCGLSKRQAGLYAKLVAELGRLLDDPDLEGIKRRGLVLSFLMKFKQVCNHPSHWSGDGTWQAADSGKFERLGEIAAELAGRRECALVFTQFQEMCEPLAGFLAGVFGRPGLVLHGGTPVKRRAALVEEFQSPGGPPFFVVSVKAGGTGLNLTRASHVVHFDRWWNPAVENQATDRAFRIGQKNNVFVHKFICQGTVEERIDALIEEKKALAGDLLGGGGAGETLLSEMSSAELMKFVALDLDAAML
jgi:superfamily II DNA or RNA helicase